MTPPKDLREVVREWAVRCMAEGSTLSERKFEMYLLKFCGLVLDAAKSNRTGDCMNCIGADKHIDALKSYLSEEEGR